MGCFYYLLFFCENFRWSASLSFLLKGEFETGLRYLTFRHAALNIDFVHDVLCGQGRFEQLIPPKIISFSSSRIQDSHKLTVMRSIVVENISSSLKNLQYLFTFYIFNLCALQGKKNFFSHFQICGQGTPPAVCCVAVNLGNSQENFLEGMLDIFTGGDLGECYNFEVGAVETEDQFGMKIVKIIIS